MRDPSGRLGFRSGRLGSPDWVTLDSVTSNKSADLGVIFIVVRVLVESWVCPQCPPRAYDAVHVLFSCVRKQKIVPGYPPLTESFSAILVRCAHRQNLNTIWRNPWLALGERSVP